MPDKVPVWRALFQPAAKVDESILRLLWSWLRWVLLALLVAVFLFAFAWARHDRGTAAVMQTADWLTRLPLTVATYVLATLAWYLHVQVVDSLRLSKWAFQWALDKVEDPAIMAAKTQAWGTYLGLSWLASCLVFSKALGA